MSSIVICILRLIRPKQWVKNLFVLAPLFFDRRIMDVTYVIPSICAFFAFCFISSSVYCFNDVYDVDADRAHPAKRYRPIAHGDVSIITGWAVMFLCALIAIGFVCMESVVGGVESYLWVVVVAYFLLNILYTIKLKHIAIIDVLIISIGFVLRVVAGGVSSNIYVSHWIILMVFLLALFLALAKRRDDVVLNNEAEIVARKNIGRYNYDFINQAMVLTTSVTMVCYIMYTVSDDVLARVGNPYLYVTSLFVLAGIMRYLQITLVDKKSGDPTKTLLKDRFIQLCVAGWIITFFMILYL